MALPGSDAISVGVSLPRFLWERPFSDSSRLVTAGAEGLKPSSISGCRMSIFNQEEEQRVSGVDLER